MKKERIIPARFYVISGIVFLILIFGIALFMILYPDSPYSKEEKRALQDFPDLNASTLADGSFMSKLETYESDQFPFRGKLMRIKTTINRLLGKHESKGVFYGKDASLIEKFVMPGQENTRKLKESLTDFRARYPDINMYFLLAPTAVSVYSEKLPESAVTDDENDYIDQLTELSSGGYDFIDVREIFQENKGSMLLYYKTDHHWTTEGAHLAYEELRNHLMTETNDETSGDMEQKSEKSYVKGTVYNRFYGSLVYESGFSVPAPDSITVYIPGDNPVYTVSHDGENYLDASVYHPDKLLSEDPYQLFLGGNYPSLTVKTSVDTEDSLLIIKDSYANCLIPFLLEDYQKVKIIDPRYYYDDLSSEIISGGYKDILFIYNANTLSKDKSLCEVLDFGKDSKPEEDDSQKESDSESTEQTETYEESVSEETSESSMETETETESGTDRDTETESESTDPGSDASEDSGISLNDVVFIGDSRTLSMGSGGKLEYRLIPDSQIFATWGGTLTENAAYVNAERAAAMKKNTAVFWYGINDVQLNPERDNEEVFLANYDGVIQHYLSMNPESNIAILSVLSTTVREQDYYAGQDDNIQKYNSILKTYCINRGYQFIDVRYLFTGDEIFAENDNIHFSESWYIDRFIPAIKEALDIRD